MELHMQRLGDAVRDQLDLKVDKAGANQVTVDNAQFINKTYSVYILYD